MILHVDVANKIATYQTRDGCIVCGNGGYQIEFNFDREWGGTPDLEAIFIVDGQPEPMYELIEEGCCDVPIIKNATKVIVGAHSESKGLTTTGTVIPCKKSIICG